MSAQSRLFTRVQNADFYRRYLLDALRLLPAGQGRTFLDVGCGPGVQTRLAAAHGYMATGLDIDASMITAGRRTARREGSAALFMQRRLTGDPRLPPSDIVAAASLLAVVSDPAATLRG